jgi:hypothetical protein
MQKQLFGAVVASTFLLVGCCEECETTVDEYGTPSSSCEETGIPDDSKVTEHAITLPDTEIDTQKGSYEVTEHAITLPDTEIDIQKDSSEVTEYAIIFPLPNTEIDTQNGSFTVTCNIKNFTPDKADGKFFWISIEDVKQAKHWPKFPVEDEQCSPNIIYEGQKNDKRAMKIDLLRIDHDTDQKFRQWINEGPRTGYPGFPLNQSDIVATVPIFLP